MPPPTFLTAAEAAPLLRLSAFHVRELCRSGKIRASRPGGKWLITEEDLVAYLEAGANTQVSA